MSETKLQRRARNNVIEDAWMGKILGEHLTPDQLAVCTIVYDDNGKQYRKPLKEIREAFLAVNYWRFFAGSETKMPPSIAPNHHKVTEGGE